MFPQEEKNAIKNSTIELVLIMSDDETVVSEQGHLLTKLNATLVGIVKQEWQISC